MDTVFTVCIVIGFAIPLLTLILGGIFDGLDGTFDGNGSIFGMDFDLDLDLDGFSICFLPISVHSICTGLLVFGAFGKIFQSSLGGWKLLLIAIGLGYCAGIVIQSMITTLKKIENTTRSKEELKDFDAHVVNTIIAGGYGSISVTSFEGITTNFPAKSENPTQVIKQGSIVSIVAFDKNTAIVKPKDPNSKYYLGNE